MRDVLDHPAVRGTFQAMLDRLARESTGSSTLVVRAMLLDEPPSIDAREITDKGSINQKAVLENRAALVDELYAASCPPACLSPVFVGELRATNTRRSHRELENADNTNDTKCTMDTKTTTHDLRNCNSPSTTRQMTMRHL